MELGGDADTSTSGKDLILGVLKSSSVTAEYPVVAPSKWLSATRDGSKEQSAEEQVSFNML